MVILEPYFRIEVIARDMLPGICNDYKEGLWDFEEATEKINHYHEVGIGLAQRFDDNLYALEMLKESHTKSEMCLELMREHKEREMFN